MNNEVEGMCEEMVAYLLAIYWTDKFLFVRNVSRIAGFPSN